MKRAKRDPEREDRIHNEAILDPGPDEQAMSWHYYLEDPFPVPGEGLGCEGRLAALER